MYLKNKPINTYKKLKTCEIPRKNYSKAKVNLSLWTTPWRRTGDWRYSSTHSLTSALDTNDPKENKIQVTKAAW